MWLHCQTPLAILTITYVFHNSSGWYPLIIYPQTWCHMYELGDLFALFPRCGWGQGLLGPFWWHWPKAWTHCHHYCQRCCYYSSVGQGQMLSQVFTHPKTPRFSSDVYLQGKDHERMMGCYHHWVHGEGHICPDWSSYMFPRVKVPW